MSYSLQAYYQVTVDQVVAVAERLDVDFRAPTEKDGSWDYRKLVVDPLADAMQPALTETHLELLRHSVDPAAHYPAPGEHDGNGPLRTDLAVVNGHQQLRPFRMVHAGDEYEIGDEWPAGYIFGVTLATRYKPTFLDWETEHGIHQYTHDDRRFRLAQEAIVRPFPEFAGGTLAVRIEHF